VTRLDGYTVDDVLKLIDHGSNPVTEGRVVLDQRASWLALGNAWLKAAADRLADAGLGDRVLLEATGKVVTNEPSVIGYYSWGSNDPAITERNLGDRVRARRLAAMFVSFRWPNRFTSRRLPGVSDPGRSGETYFGGAPQSLAGRLDSARACHRRCRARGRSRFSMRQSDRRSLSAYFSGMNLAESFYLAMPNVSWGDGRSSAIRCAPLQERRHPLDLARSRVSIRKRACQSGSPTDGWRPSRARG
jgi:hypothetical protein